MLIVSDCMVYSHPNIKNLGSFDLMYQLQIEPEGNLLCKNLNEPQSEYIVKVNYLEYR